MKNNYQNPTSTGYQNNNPGKNNSIFFEHKEGQGSLFRNEKQSDRQPDYRGTIVIGGVTYQIAGWVKTSKKGMSYMSLKASLPKEIPFSSSDSIMGMMSRASANFEKSNKPF